VLTNVKLKYILANNYNNNNNYNNYLVRLSFLSFDMHDLCSVYGTCGCPANGEV